MHYNKSDRNKTILLFTYDNSKFIESPATIYICRQKQTRQQSRRQNGSINARHNQPRLLSHRAVRVNLHSRHNGHGTRSHGFWGFLNFHEAHAAITGNGEAVVVAETGYLYAYFITGL